MIIKRKYGFLHNKNRLKGELKMYRIPYTIEMQQIDRKWDNVEEFDLSLMEKLHDKIYKQAVAQGFKGIVKTNEYDDEFVSMVFPNEHIMEEVSVENMTIEELATCRGLIQALNNPNAFIY